mgnify:CR=1 FL=1
MSLEILKCPSCGANVEFNEGVESCECEYCGAKLTKTSAQNKNNSNASKTDFLSTPNTNKDIAAPASEIIRNSFLYVSPNVPNCIMPIIDIAALEATVSITLIIHVNEIF